jgi:hypothetical protein
MRLVFTFGIEFLHRLNLELRYSASYIDCGSNAWLNSVSVSAISLNSPIGTLTFAARKPSQPLTL